MFTATSLKYEVDHINNIKGDNRIINLREVTHYCNMQNSTANTSGCSGVSYRKAENCWITRHTTGGKRKYIGRFKSKQDAIAAKEACIEAGKDQRCFTEQIIKL